MQVIGTSIVLLLRQKPALRDTLHYQNLSSHLEVYNYRILHECSCLSEFIKRVEEKRWNARLAEHFISNFLRKNMIILSLCTQSCYGRHNVSRKSLNY